MIKKIDKSYLIFAVFFAALLIMSILRCNLGQGTEDEALCAVIPLRLSQGDALIADEWHVSQMASFLTLPFFELGRLILGSTDGILLFLRGTYLFLHSVSAVVIFMLLRKFDKYSAVFAALLYYVFVPFNVMVMGYNTMGLACVTLTGVLLSVFGAEKRYILVISGLIFAAVICNPYLAGVFALYTLAVIVANAVKKADGLLKFKSWLMFTAGCAVLAAVFLAFVLSRASISEITANLQGIFSDPEHVQISFFESFLNYLKYNLFGPTLSVTAIVSTLAAVILFTSVCGNKKRRAYRAWYMIAASVCAAYMIATKTAVMFPMAIVGLFAYILLENKPKRLFYCLWIPGFCYSVCMNLSSNQKTYIINSGFTPAAVVSVMFVGLLLAEMKDEIKSKINGKAALITVCAAVVLCFGFNINTRINFIFADDIDHLDYKITKGPSKGLMTCEYVYDIYDRFYDDLAVFRDLNSTDNIFFATDKTWMYLCVGDMRSAAYSAWLSGETDQSFERLMLYYSLHPDKMPKYVYIPKNSKWNFELWQNFAAENGYTLGESDVAYMLGK